MRSRIFRRDEFRKNVMCGISGFWGHFPETLLTDMSSAIAHRGPDDSGMYFDAQTGIGLVQRRLSIIDLSPEGHQPMWDDDRRAAIIYNGETYNFLELRAELQAGGVVFRGHSDTEVLLHLYLRDGDKMLSRLNGIFAFAIWDTARQELFIARDGQGIKPFYYSETPKGFVYASELKALLHEPSVPRDIDPIAVSQYLTFLYCPAPRTMLSGVKKLEAGKALVLKAGRIVRNWRYYELPFGAAKSKMSTADAVEAVRKGVETAVERQMVADVPVGAFLSGGLDSSSVAAFAKKFSSEKLQCFTIDVRGTGGTDADGSTSDLPYAQKAAAYLGVDLHTVTVGPDMATKLAEMIYHLDEPQADPAPINALLISQLARDNGIKVLLSGAGGDDIFTGYRRHFALMQEKYWSWMPGWARSGLRTATRALPGHRPVSRRLRKAFEYADMDEDARIASYFFWLKPDVTLGLLAPTLHSHVKLADVSAPFMPAGMGLSATASRLDRMLYLDCKYFLSDHNLNYTDKMSMAHGVEVRVPLLDPDLIALAASLPDHLKQNGPVGKWVFKKAMEPYLPRDIIYRPKTGFGAPLRHWIHNELRPLVNDTLSSDTIKKRGLFDSNAVAALIKADLAGQIDAAYTIFSLVCIEIWCRIFIDSPVPQRPY